MSKRCCCPTPQLHVVLPNALKPWSSHSILEMGGWLVWGPHPCRISVFTHGSRARTSQWCALMKVTWAFIGYPLNVSLCWTCMDCFLVCCCSLYLEWIENVQTKWNRPDTKRQRFHDVTYILESKCLNFLQESRMMVASGRKRGGYTVQKCCDKVRFHLCWLIAGN